MEKLTQIQIEKGLEYWFIEDGPDKSVVELAEYSGEKELTINCTQLDGYPHGSKYQSAEYLHIGSGAGVLSVEPLAELKNLVMLSVENFQKINDYSALVALNNLEMLSISGDVWAPKNIHIDSLDFLCEMKQLRSFSLEVAIVKSKDYTPLLELKNIEYLTVGSRKEVKAIYDQLMKLPKLKYGMLVEHPELYQS